MRSGRGTGKPPRGLSGEDAALWNHVAGTTEPLRRAKARVPAHETEHAQATGSSPAGASAPPSAPSAAAKPRPNRQAHPPAAVPAAKPPPLAEFDRKKARKIAAGREPIDARIDLHGLRQSAAHSALRSFLLACHADGKRNVLVITGKGTATGDDDTSRPFALDMRERGVLRRSVPIWLAEPELRAIVVSFSDAGRSHGGAGALYVHLRARRKTAR